MNDDTSSAVPPAAGYGNDSAASRRANLYLVGETAVAPNRGSFDQSGSAPRIDRRNPPAARESRPRPSPGSQRAAHSHGLLEGQSLPSAAPLVRAQTSPSATQQRRTGPVSPRADRSRPLASPLGTLGQRLHPHSAGDGGNGAAKASQRSSSSRGASKSSGGGASGGGRRSNPNVEPRRLRGPLLWLGPIAAVVLGLGVLVYPIQNYLAMRQSIAGALAEQVALTDQRTCLEDAVGQLREGDSLTLEARQRFGMVEPGNVVVRSTTELPAPVASSCLTASGESAEPGGERLSKSRQILNALSEFFVF